MRQNDEAGQLKGNGQLASSREVFGTCASRCIGAVIALDLSRLGYDVGLNDIETEEAKATEVADALITMGQKQRSFSVTLVTRAPATRWLALSLLLSGRWVRSSTTPVFI